MFTYILRSKRCLPPSRVKSIHLCRAKASKALFGKELFGKVSSPPFLRPDLARETPRKRKKKKTVHEREMKEEGETSRPQLSCFPVRETLLRYLASIGRRGSSSLRDFARGNTNRKLVGHRPDFWFRPNFDRRGDTTPTYPRASLINLIYHLLEQEFLLSGRRKKNFPSPIVTDENKKRGNFPFYSIVFRRKRCVLFQTLQKVI